MALQTTVTKRTATTLLTMMMMIVEHPRTLVIIVIMNSLRTATARSMHPKARTTTRRVCKEGDKNMVKMVT